jgi:hypothetical protein
MSVQEFADLITESGVLNESFSRNEIYPLWNQSMMTQVDEINEAKHLNMNFTEFIEAICRVADRLAIPNLVRDEFETWEEAFTPALVNKYK